MPLCEQTLVISTHAPRTGGDLPVSFPPGRPRRFQPTPPAQGATITAEWMQDPQYYFNPRPPHRGRLGQYYLVPFKQKISTHAPRTGGDGLTATALTMAEIFQPTPPAQGATRPPPRVENVLNHFNPRPPHRGRRIDCHSADNGGDISTHAPRTGGDKTSPPGRKCFEPFQPTPPAQGATSMGGALLNAVKDFNPRPPRRGRQEQKQIYLSTILISTHAPRAGGDVAGCKLEMSKKRFQPTPPAQGATRETPQRTLAMSYFNPRPPRRGRLDVGDLRKRPIDISTHAPRAGGDHYITAAATIIIIFQPTPPAQGATGLYRRSAGCRKFQPTPPAQGATSSHNIATCCKKFQPTPPAQGATGSLPE